MLDAQPFSTPHTEPRVNGLIGQLCGYFELAGASGRTRPEALFGQNASVCLSTVLPAASVSWICAKSGSPEKSLTISAGSALVVVFFPLRKTCETVTGSLYDFRVTLSSKAPFSEVR